MLSGTKPSHLPAASGDKNKKYHYIKYLYLLEASKWFAN